MARKAKTASAALKDLPTEMSVMGQIKLSDVYDDLVIYRNLEPLDKRIKGLRRAAGRMGVMNDSIPRKHDEDYAAATVWFIEEAQQLREVPKNIKELLVIGDSAYNDGHAFKNVRELSRWDGSCFIGAEAFGDKPQGKLDEETNIYVANRWGALATWASWLVEQEYRLNEETAVIIDIDKTLFGARGRNDHMIDQARLQGIYRTLDSVLGNRFDKAAFERQYSELSEAKYNHITEDNLDYLVYACLVINATLIQFDELVGQVESGSIDNFPQFVRWVNSRMINGASAGEKLRQVHESVMTGLHVGDPTPFKRLREQEFISTAALMGNAAKSSEVGDLLEDEIVITNEVIQISRWFKKRGCLLLCMSDKPSESACPEPQVMRDMIPLHRIKSNLVGTDIEPILKAL